MAGYLQNNPCKKLDNSMLTVHLMVDVAVDVAVEVAVEVAVVACTACRSCGESVP